MILNILEKVGKDTVLYVNIIDVPDTGNTGSPLKRVLKDMFLYVGALFVFLFSVFYGGMPCCLR